MKHIIIETTERCNLKCPGCYRDYTGAHGGHMEWDLLVDIVEQIKRYPWDERPVIEPFSHGEPTVYPWFLEASELLNDSGFPFLLSTNGTGSVETLLKVAAMPGCQSIYVSLDGLYPSTRNLFRPGSEKAAGAAYEMVSANLCPISATLLNLGQPWSEIQEFIAFWLDAGAERVVVRRPLPQEPMRIPLEGWKECYYLHWWYMTIKSDGRVMLCERYAPSPVIGNMTTDTLEDIMSIDLQEWGKDVCPTCPARYCGKTMYGEVADARGESAYHVRMDYFNTIYSKRDLRYGLAWDAARLV